MSTSDKIELGLIPIVGIGVWWMTRGLSYEIPVGRLLLAASAILLLQGLVRDLSLLARQRRIAQRAPRRVARCLCVESTVGATGIVIGAVLLGAGSGAFFVVSGWMLSVLLIAQMSLGFLIKDTVLEWSPWRLYQDKDHLNIVFTWKQ